MLLSSAYFPNVHYFTKVLQSESTQIEAQEHYIKQSYRNRCSIYAANGIIDLTIPIIKGRSRGILCKDIKIDYAMPWQKNHLRSLHSAYSRSPFYEFFIDELSVFFIKKEVFLLDHNTRILEVLLEQIDAQQTKITHTKVYTPSEPDETSDWRYQIHPKVSYTADSEFKPMEYSQNFEHKKGFQPNLSILDTLFQLGPETRKYIDDCTIKT